MSLWKNRNGKWKRQVRSYKRKSLPSNLPYTAYMLHGQECILCTSRAVTIILWLESCLAVINIIQIECRCCFYFSLCALPVYFMTLLLISLLLLLLLFVSYFFFWFSVLIVLIVSRDAIDLYRRHLFYIYSISIYGYSKQNENICRRKSIPAHLKKIVYREKISYGRNRFLFFLNAEMPKVDCIESFLEFTDQNP